VETLPEVVRRVERVAGDECDAAERLPEIPLILRELTSCRRVRLNSEPAVC